MLSWRRLAALGPALAALSFSAVGGAQATSASASAGGKPALPELPAASGGSRPAPSAAPPKASPVASGAPAKASAAPAVTAPPAPAPATAAAHKPSPTAPKVAKTAAHPSGRPGVRPVESSVRRGVAGGPTAEDVAFGVESPELHALHQAELELFPPAIPAMGTAWPGELASPLSAAESSPRAHASGLPPASVTAAPRLTEGGRDVSWIARLQLPDLPVRWDARLVRYLEFYKDDPRGRQLFAYWLKRSGRYRDALRRSLRKKALPEDLAWLPMVESGYDTVARSPAGAAGLWQLTADTAHLYGLSTERWADQRLNPLAETEAAVEMLSDLYRRFGSWELAMAAYNMGYGGVMAVVRRYNTNDYWTLARMEAALPWETSLYVPKIVAAAIVGRNLAAFGYSEAGIDAPLDGEEVRVPPGTSLQSVAAAAGCTLKEVEALNPELRAGRTPPASPVAGQAAGGQATDAAYPVRVPLGKGGLAQANLARSKDAPLALDRYVVRFGESIEQIATARKVPVARLVELNALGAGEVVRGGTVLLVPRAQPGTAPATLPKPPESPAAGDAARPVVVIPPDLFVYPDRRRVFYRVVTGDTLPDIATHLHVDVDDLRRWNDLDPAARLQDGMTLQLFVPEGADLSRVVLLSERDVRTLVVGTDEFFAYWEGTKGKRRVVVTAKAGDTLESIGRRHGVNPASMERINGRGRRESLKEGETVVVYVVATAPDGAASRPTEAAPADALDGLVPLPTGPLPPAPEASLLPRVP